MTSTSSSTSQKWPASTTSQNIVTVSALEGGAITMPERFFIAGVEGDPKKLVPSMCFLIQHQDPKSSVKTTLLFDLGLRKPLEGYPEILQKHLQTRAPISSEEDVVHSLRKGGMEPKNIDVVVLSHVHWDHTGDPTQFPNAVFVAGAGSFKLLQEGVPNPQSHMHFEKDLLPFDRRIEMPPISGSEPTSTSQSAAPNVRGKFRGRVWKPLGHFKHAIDIFEDGSVYIIDSAGHLPGHQNLLARTSTHEWVYLGGDACHDLRILTGERGIAEWTDDFGECHSIHSDKAAAERTIEDIRKLMNPGTYEGEYFEIVLAHDNDWHKRNGDRFFPGRL